MTPKSPSTTFACTPTVLGMEVMEELDPAGARLKTYVRLGARAVAEPDVSSDAVARPRPALYKSERNNI